MVLHLHVRWRKTLKQGNVKKKNLFKYFPSIQLLRTVFARRLCVVQGLLAFGHSAESAQRPYFLFLNLCEPMELTYGMVCAEEALQGVCLEHSSRGGKGHGLL